jgi:TRAP-type C4-dicarboxylate transport system permease small subunit
MRPFNVSSLIRGLAATSHIAAGLALIAMMMVVVANIFGRIFLGSPLTGTLEIAGFGGLVVVAIAIVFTEYEHRNVIIDFVVIQMPPKIQGILKRITYFLSLGAVAILFYAAVGSGVEALRDGERTLTLSIRTFPFWFIWGAGVLCLWSCILQHFIQALTAKGRK